jgi:hypothetical protein
MKSSITLAIRNLIKQQLRTIDGSMLTAFALVLDSGLHSRPAFRIDQSD